MADPDYNKMIKECKWRKNAFDTSFCKLNITLCNAAIDKGECVMLREFFAGLKENDGNGREEGERDGKTT